MRPLHLTYALAPLSLALTTCSAQYVDDGYFDPRTVSHLDMLTYEEVKDFNFRKEIAMERIKRRLEDAADGDDAVTDDPNPNTDDTSLDCSLTGDGGVYCCTNCDDQTMDKCRVLGGALVHDTYGLAKQENRGENSCVDLENRASRLDVFGPTKTFRDSEECRQMVYDYTCYWWGSDNQYYWNPCKDQAKELIDGSIVKVKDPPCKSYCLEVAAMCSNRPDWIKLCDGVECLAAGGDYTCVVGPQTDSGAMKADCNPKMEAMDVYSPAIKTDWSFDVTVAAALVSAFLSALV